MQIKYLASQGMQVARVAARLGICRQTVYNHLNRKADTPFPKPRSKRPSKLDPFKAYIRARLESFDLPATVLFEEIKTKGYDGSLTILREFVRPLRDELVRRVTERFETVPGQQAQMDWGECGMIRVGSEFRKLYVFVLVLGYSRMLYGRFTTSSKLPVLLGCLSRAFTALGIPAELLVDNMKQAVDQHDVTTGTVRWNRQFLDFVDHYSVLPVASPPYWPRVKGKVERGVGYIKSCFLEGRTFTDLDDLNTQLEAWLEHVAKRAGPRHYWRATGRSIQPRAGHPSSIRGAAALRYASARDPARRVRFARELRCSLLQCRPGGGRSHGDNPGRRRQRRQRFQSVSRRPRRWPSCPLPEGNTQSHASRARRGHP